jgi:hypothetical protein
VVGAGSGMVPSGSAATVPRGLQVKGPGPFLIWPRMDLAAPLSRYAWALSISATMP